MVIQGLNVTQEMVASHGNQLNLQVMRTKSKDTSTSMRGTSGLQIGTQD